jgi:hypothetical protein
VRAAAFGSPQLADCRVGLRENREQLHLPTHSESRTFAPYNPRGAITTVAGPRCLLPIRRKSLIAGQLRHQIGIRPESSLPIDYPGAWLSSGAGWASPNPA